MPNELAARLAGLGILISGLTSAASLQADEKATIEAYRSVNFRLQTDLPPKQALARLERLECTLKTAAKYWRRPSKGVISVYLMHDLDLWRNANLPHRFAVLVVHGAGGATLRTKTGVGRGALRQATIYASTRSGVAEHEVLHAYCVTAFGDGGPDWYKEGMAEMLGRDCMSRASVVCPKSLANTLQSKKQRSLNEVVRRGEFTGHLAIGINRIVADYGGEASQLPVSLWKPSYSRSIDEARKTYCWSWALCNMLHHNPNYAAKFRQLGNGFLTGSRSFNNVFSVERAQIEFEFRQYIRHLKTGYRVDLCAWDWKKRFRDLDDRDKVTVRIQARRGFQPSGVNVRKGQVYRFVASGTWRLAPGEQLMDAKGRAGRGRLVGVVFDRYKLGETISLGTHGAFIAASSGRLYLRCNDGFSKLADNEGSVLVEIRR